MKTSRTRRRRGFAAVHPTVPQSTLVPVPASLPPPVEASTGIPPIYPRCPHCQVEIKNPRRKKCSVCQTEWTLLDRYPEKAALPEGIRKDDTSPMRLTCTKIATMQAAGLPNEDIAAALGIEARSIKGMMWKAGRNGWLDFDEPKNRLEYQILPKALKNLDEAMSSDAVLNTGMKERNAISLKIVEGTLYPQFATQAAPATNATLVGVRVEIVGGGDKSTVREGTIMGNAEYVDAETVESRGCHIKRSCTSSRPVSCIQARSRDRKCARVPRQLRSC